MLVILFLTYLPEERHELGTYKIKSEVVPGNANALSANSQLQENRIKYKFVRRAKRENPTLA